MAVDIGERELRPGVRPLAANESPRTLGPAREVEVPGDLDVPVGAFAAVLIARRNPDGVGDLEDRGPDRFGQVIADRGAHGAVSAPVQQLVARTGTVDAQQDLDRLDVRRGDLLKRGVGDRDLVGGGVRAGVPRAQLAAQRFAGLIAVGQHRVKAEAALEVALGALLVRMARDKRRVQVDVELLGRPDQLPRARARHGVRRRQPLKPARVTRDPVDHPKRRRGRRDLPEQHLLITERTKVRQAVPAVGEHHRQVADHAALVVARTPALQIGQLARQRPREPRLLGDLSEQRAARVRHQALSARRDFYGNPAPIVRHLQGDPPKLDLRPSARRRIPARADSQAAPATGAATAS